MFTGALTLGWVAQARGQVHAVGISMLATHLVYFAGVELVVLLGWPPVAAPLALVVAETLSAGGLWIWIVRTMGPVTRPLPLVETWRFLEASLPIGGANILRGAVVGSDVLLLGLFASKAEVGLYGAAFKLYSLGLSLGTMYFALLLPHLAARNEQSFAAVKTAMHAASRRTLLAATPIVVAALLLAGPVLHLLFGASFEAATGALRILVLALPLNLVAGHFRILLVATGRQRRDLSLVAIGTVVHVSAKLILIPAVGFNGAAWGTLVGEAALMLLSWFASAPAAEKTVRGT
jgi:O-antigen/teichoic acid export membrane protein